MVRRLPRPDGDVVRRGSADHRHHQHHRALVRAHCRDCGRLRLHASEEGQRLWRKNLRDNDGNSQVTSPSTAWTRTATTPTRWDATTRGRRRTPPARPTAVPLRRPNPRRRRSTACSPTSPPRSSMNYHSAAELLLQGRRSSPHPHRTTSSTRPSSGTTITPADPRVSSPTSRRTLRHERRPRLAHPEEAHAHARTSHPRCRPARAPADGIGHRRQLDHPADDCNYQGFDYPDDETLIQAKNIEKNIPFALAVAESAIDPDDPVWIVNRDAEDFRVELVHGVLRQPPDRGRGLEPSRQCRRKRCTTRSTAGTTVKNDPLRVGRR